MARAPPMRSTGQVASINSTSTLKHKPSSSSRTFGTPSTLVAQLSSHDLSGSYAKDEKMLLNLNIGGRQSPQSISGLKRTAARSEIARKKSSADMSLGANQKVAFSKQPLMASSSENQFPKERRGRASPVVAVARQQPGATRVPAGPPANALDLINVSRQSKPLPPVEPRAVFADFLSASPSSMGTSELPVYSSDEESSIRHQESFIRERRRPRTGRSASRTPSFGSRRQGVIGHPDSSSSESDADSIVKSLDSVSTAHTASTANRSSRYARLLVAIGI